VVTNYYSQSRDAVGAREGHKFWRFRLRKMMSTPTTRAVTFIQHQDNIVPFTHLDIGGPVATLSLDHAGGNRINFDMRVELREAFQRIEKSPARVLLIRGEGGDWRGYT